MIAAYDNLIADMKSGGLVLTANRRLYRYLLELYDQHMLNSGEAAWVPPQLLSYEAWLQKCLSDLGEEWRLLKPLQVQFLWEQMIEESSYDAGLDLLQVPKTAEKAIQAYRLLNEYELELDPSQLTEDQSVFKYWFDKFTALLNDNQWFDKSALPALIRHAMSTERLDKPDRLRLVGFDQLPPGLTKLRTMLLDHGCDCLEVTLASVGDPAIAIYQTQERKDEVEDAARWVRELLERGETGIGVVVPDLTRRRSEIERIFRAQIDPLGAVSLNDDEVVFSLSLGGPLSDQGVIHAALQILQAGPVLTFDQISFLLRTPYLGKSCSEGDARSLFEVKLRSFNQQRFSLDSLATLAESFGLSDFSRFAKQLNANVTQTMGGSPGSWGQLFAEQLKKLGWPGQRTLTSREYQAIKSWQQNVLEVVPQLDTLGHSISRNKIVAMLVRLSHETEFQVEAATGPVQVVGLLESTGLQFNHLWVMGLEERIFPAAPQPNPFIPYQMQVDHGMPHADAARELAYAEQVMARLLAAADRIILSCPQFDGDMELQASPLLPEAVDNVPVELFPPQDVLSHTVSQSCSLDIISDLSGPMLEDVCVEGGTGLLKDQAHCPFRAFVHHRLRARGLDSSTPGISAMVRGDLVHLALENIWRQLQDQANLIALGDDERSQLIDVKVVESLDAFYQQRPRPSELMLALEKERISGLVEEWLQTVEMERAPFKVVATEAPHTEQLGPLQISLKVDRIDELESGFRVVVDYKTGSQLRADDLISEPLIEPQLPIYAVAQEQSQADGVVFAQVRKGSCRLLGIVRESGLLGRVGDIAANKCCQDAGITDWGQLLIFWQRQIHQLASDFVAGKAAVQPFDPAVSCLYCDLKGLCRIQDSLMLVGDENDS